MKLAVFLTDSLSTFAKKGELRTRYYNPLGTFDEVHFLSPGPEPVDPASLQLLVGDARMFIHPIGPFSDPAWWLPRTKVRRLLKRISPDAIRAYDPGIRGTLAVLWGRRFEIPSIISVHADLDEQRAVEGRWLHRLRRPFERFALTQASRVVCVTEHVAEYARRNGAAAPEVIYNRVYVAQFEGPETIHRDRPHPPTILSVGRMVPQKYQECLIRAIAELDVRLVLIGEGPLRTELEELAESLTGNRVEFVPSVPNGEIQTYYRSADIFAIATHYEGFCIPVLEAMASRLPVVASRIGAIAEVLGPGGVLVDNDPEQFRDALAELLADPSRMTRLGALGHHRAVELDGSEMEKREARMYSDVIESSARPSPSYPEEL